MEKNQYIPVMIQSLKKKHDKIINIMQLRFFCQVALRGSVSRAADDLFRTQSEYHAGIGAYYGLTAKFHRTVI